MFVAGIYRELCLESVKNKYECEIQAACQHWEVRGQRLSQGLCEVELKIDNRINKVGNTQKFSKFGFLQ